MRHRKERFKLCLWAMAVLITVPLLISFIPSTKDSAKSNSEDTEDIFSEQSSYQDPPLIPDSATLIVSADLSGKAFTNNTKYVIDESKLSFEPQFIDSSAPLILIIHTYGTQSYSKENYILPSSTLKSENEAENVICTGKALAQALEAHGIKVIHDKTLYDKISYSGAYNLSIESVKNYLKEYPSIKYVIDIQRDSLFTQSGKCVKAVTNTEKGKTAQISFIAGSDENGADFPNWKSNLSLSLDLSKELSKISPKLSRGVTLMPSGYGQYTSSGFITVEIGTSGNTPNEAENASYYLAEAIVSGLFT